MPNYKIVIKEKGNSKPITTFYDGNVDENYVIDFFGLKNDDVESYTITKE